LWRARRAIFHWFWQIALDAHRPHGTEFVIALIPLGGYVKMLDERVEPVAPELRHSAFNNKTVGQRAAIIAAGPVANFIFAIFAYWLVFIIGVPGVRPVVGEIAPNSIAANAQITPGWNLKRLMASKPLIGMPCDCSWSPKLAMRRPPQRIAVWFRPRQDKVLDLRHWRFEPDKEDPVAALGFVRAARRLSRY
jgi:regulator of sigma E protease